MNKRRQASGAPQPTAAQTANPIALSLDSPLKIQFDAGSQLRITVVTPEKPPAPLNRLIRSLIVLAFVSALFWSFISILYLQPEFPPSADSNDASLSIALAHPGYVAYGDDAEMDLSVTNIGGQSFTGSVTVNFPSGVPVRPLASETTTIKIEKLSPNACVTGRLKFALRQQTQWLSGATIPTRFLISTDDRSFPPVVGPPIAVAPFPFLRTINSWLGNSVVLGAIAALLWEVMIKRFFGWEAKG